MRAEKTTAEFELYHSTRLDNPIFPDLVEQFVDEIPERIAVMLAAHAENDSAGVQRAAHQFKGSTAMHGFEIVSPFAARLETAVKDGAPACSVSELIEQLIVELKKMRSGSPNSVD